MMALLIVISSCAVTTVSAGETICPPLTVTKTVWDREEWVPEIHDVVKGDIVRFNITVTFYNQSSCTNYAYDIVIEDLLPEDLEYKSTISPREPDEIVNNTIIWNFTSDPDYYLSDGESLSIVFEAVADDYGEFKNEVEVTGIDFCTGKTIYDDASAWVHVEPRLDVEKEVWDPDEQKWVETLDGVIKDVDVRFQITITYHGPGYVTCMEVWDWFEEDCECLEYLGNEEFIYPDDPNDPLFNDPKITFGEDWVTYTWRSDLEILFNLKDAESVIIRFDANVTDYCYDEEDNTVINYVEACAWNCEDYESEVCGGDTAEVVCRPHDPVFEKKVWNGKEWAEETYTHVEGKVKFRLQLTYYGSYNLTNIKIVDYLPKDILEYIGPSSFYAPATIPIEWGVEYSDDKQTVWWNTTTALNDSETLTIEFYALVIGSTGDCEECGINRAEYTATESEEDKPKSGEDTAQVHAGDAIGIEICIRKRLHIGRISTYITSSHEDLEDVDWTIKVTGGVFKRVNALASGTVSLSEDIPKQVSLPWRSRIVRKGGRVTITVTATPPGAGTIEKTFKGIVIGRFVFITTLKMPRPL